MAVSMLMRVALSVMLALSLVEGVVIRDYNAVNFVQLYSFDEFRDAYMNLDADKLNQNVMLGVSTESCSDLLLTPAFRGTQRHSGGGQMVTVTLPASEFPISLPDGKCAEVRFYMTGDSLDTPSASTTSFDHQSLNKWVADRMRIPNMKFINKFPYPVEIWWHEESQEPLRTGSMEPGEAFTVGTFIGHIFTAHSLNPLPGIHDPDKENDLEGGYKNIIDYMTIDGQDYEFSPKNRLETCEFAPEIAVTAGADEGAATGTVVQSTNTIAGNVVDCGDLYARLIEYTHRNWYDKRLGLNFVQPQFVEPVTETGFEHRQLPKETFQWLRSWYDAEQRTAQQVESSSGPCMNQHVAPSAVTHLTAEFKNKLSADLKEILQEWALPQFSSLELTSIYGVRKYNNGSVLRMHVDTVNTHVVSAIINVDQEVDEDWPLLILDHDDNEHRIVMKPGDMVLYESAKLLHGRPDVFKGKHYDNIFIHYKPTSGWNYDWM